VWAGLWQLSTARTVVLFSSAFISVGCILTVASYTVRSTTSVQRMIREENQNRKKATTQARVTRWFEKQLAKAIGKDNPKYMLELATEAGGFLSEEVQVIRVMVSVGPTPVYLKATVKVGLRKVWLERDGGWTTLEADINNPDQLTRLAESASWHVLRH